MLHATHIDTLSDELDKQYRSAEFNRAIGLVMEAIQATNRYFSKCEPWKLVNKKGKPAKPEDLARLGTILYISLEATRICSLMLSPIMPGATSGILDRLGIPPSERNFQSLSFRKSTGQPLDSNKSFKAFAIPDLPEYAK